MNSYEEKPMIVENAIIRNEVGTNERIIDSISSGGVTKRKHRWMVVLRLPRQRSDCGTYSEPGFCFLRNSSMVLLCPGVRRAAAYRSRDRDPHARHFAGREAYLSALATTAATSEGRARAFA